MSAPSTTSSGTKRKRTSEMKFYAVRAGHRPGIYHTWADCKEQITGFKGAYYKSFTSLTDAEAYMRGTDSISTSNTAPKKFYAVQNGRHPGVYTDWPTAQKQIIGWIKPKHKSFTTRAEAEAFVAQGQQLADPATVFPPDPSFLVPKVEGSQAEASDPTPMAKKSKTAKPKAAAQVPLGPGYDFLPPDADDGFDKNIIMDPQSGQLRYRTDLEQNAMKLMPKTDHGGEMLHIWTDGACMGNGQSGSVGGVGVYFGQHDPRNVAEPLLGRQTNNRAELTALKRALNIAPLNRPVMIHTDSSYAINCVTKWYIQWRKKSWRNTHGKPVENKDLIEEVTNIIQARHMCKVRTHFEWVKGHAGNLENEAADQLAVQGALENSAKGIGHSAVGDSGELINGNDGSSMDDEFGSDAFADAPEILAMT